MSNVYRDDELERLRGHLMEYLDPPTSGWPTTAARLLATIAARDEEIARLTRDIETGFMQGAYARLHGLQVAERERDTLREEIARLRAEVDYLQRMARAYQETATERAAPYDGPTAHVPMCKYGVPLSEACSQCKHGHGEVKR